jgi:hypothetical protein
MGPGVGPTIGAKRSPPADSGGPRGLVRPGCVAIVPLPPLRFPRDAAAAPIGGRCATPASRPVSGSGRGPGGFRGPRRRP